MKTIEQIIGEQIKQRRKRLNMTQAELARVAKVSLQTINILENGKRAAQRGNLEAITKALGCTREDLVRDPNSMSVKTASPTIESLLEIVKRQEAEIGALKARTPAGDRYALIPDFLLELLRKAIIEDRASDVALAIRSLGGDASEFFAKLRGEKASETSRKVKR